MGKIAKAYKKFWGAEKSLRNVLAALFFLVASLIVNYYANIYVNIRASNYVSDIILDNLPIVNVDFLFFEGFVIFIAILVVILFFQPRKIAFTVKSIALFILIRSAFISLTHVAMPPVHSFVDPVRFLADMTAGNDLFFSSHTGLPFLLALIFWRNLKMRVFFIASSALFAVAVLLGHLHYSIDVFAAYFIAYGIYRLSQKFFYEDFRLFMGRAEKI